MSPGRQRPPIPHGRGKRKKPAFSNDLRRKRLRLNWDTRTLHLNEPQLFPKRKPCALCSSSRTSRAGVKRRLKRAGCSVCMVALCAPCFQLWHTVEDLAALRFDDECNVIGSPPRLRNMILAIKWVTGKLAVGDFSLHGAALRPLLKNLRLSSLDLSHVSWQNEPASDISCDP